MAFRKAVDLDLVTKRINQHRQKPGHNVTMIFTILFCSSPLYKQLIRPLSIVT